MARDISNVVINVQHLKLDMLEGDGLLFEKELIYVGSFAKEEDDLEFTIAEADIDHWVVVCNEMLSDGEVIPFPLGHTDDPSVNQADALQFFKRVDSQGRIGLFAKGKWRDEEAKRLGKLQSNQVSIFSPASWTSGRKKIYARPIKHIAITNDPVIGGLDPFKTIVASLSKVRKMTIQDLAKALGIEVSADDTDETLATKITEAFAALNTKIGELAAPDPAATPADSTKKPEDPNPEQKPEISAGFKRLLADNRKMKIEALVNARVITPAVAEKLKSQYCSDASLQLSLGSKSDDFDQLIEVLKSNGPVLPATGEKTGGQDNLTLSQGAKNPLIANAEKRANDSKFTQPC